MNIKQLHATGILVFAGMLFAFAAMGCGKDAQNGIEVTSEPATVLLPPVHTAPSISLIGNPPSVTVGVPTTLIWSAADATSCFAVWTASTAVSGSQVVTPMATTVYSIICDGVTAETTVTVNSLPPPPSPACSDGVDNDGDGLTDYPADPGCTSSSDNDEFNQLPPPPSPACSDGVDNDGDGLTDYPADPGCTSSSDNDEYNTPPPPPVVDNPPSVSITWPTQDMLVGGVMKVFMAATDDHSVVKAEAYLDGALVATSSPPSYYIDVNLEGVADGVHTILVKVYDDRDQENETTVSVVTDAAQLRAQALVFLSAYSSGGYAIKFAALPITISVSADFSEAQFGYVKEAAQFWERYTGLTFVLEHSQTAYSFDCWVSPPEKKIYIQGKRPLCVNGAIAECSRAVSFGEVPWVVISVDSTQLTIDPALTDYWQGFVRIIAHEIGHTFTRNHTANMSIMDPGGPADYPTFKLPPDMARAFWILYFELKPFDPIPAQ